ncbi:MAG: T9SS type A sorting domain-containing protein, partial [Paludibacteraceae bacterium]|nr:T9SS type A sorting domain-containing protein [Paludibacteraceae bacterium]
VADSIYEGDTYLFIDTLLTTEDTYTRTIPRVAGCDSTINLTLSFITPPAPICTDTTVAYTDSIYVGDTYLFIDTLIAPTKADTVTCQRVLPREGTTCDSTINLTLIAMRVQERDTLRNTIKANLCYKEAFTDRLGVTYHPTQDTVVLDTLPAARFDTTDTKIVTIDSIYRYELKVWKAAIDSLKKDTILEDNLPYKWKPVAEEHQYYVAGTYYDTAKNILGCDSVHYTLELKVIEHDTIEVIVPDSNLCDGDVYTSRWQELTMVGREEIFDTTFNDTVKSVLIEPLLMNDTIYKYHLYVWPKTKYPEVFKDTIDNDKWPYIWNVYAKSVGDTVKETITEGGQHFHHRKNILECDSIVYELQLAVRTVETRYATPVEDYVCKGTPYSGRLTKDTIINGLTEWQDSLRQHVGLLAIDSIYTYKIDTLPTKIPDDEISQIKAFCDYPVDYSYAWLNVAEFVNPSFIFAQITDTIWEVETHAGWQPAATTILTSDDEQVRVRVTVVTECETTVSTSQPYEVKMATADDKKELTIPASQKYGSRIIMIDKNATEALGWTIPEADVTWYQVVGDLDDHGYYSDPADWDDKKVHEGQYYYTLTDGAPIQGQFYAVIAAAMKPGMTCGAELRTPVLVCNEAKAIAPVLAPTLVNPNEAMTLSGLNPNEHYTVRVIAMDGSYVNKLDVNANEAINLKAASIQGMYIVNVQSANDNVSLKYIVK